MSDPTNTVKHTPLLPCPFCGGEAKAHIWEMDNEDRYGGVECTICPAEVAYAVAWMDDGEAELAKAIAAWNRRAPAPQEKGGG